ISHWPIEHPDLQLVNDPSKELVVRKQWEQYSEWQMVLGVLKGSPPPHALYIYENKSVMPRAFLVGNISQFTTSDSLLKALGSQSAPQLRSTALVQTGDIRNPKEFPSPLQESDVTISYPRPDRAVIHSWSDAAAILVLTDNYNKYWRAWVDGVETDIFPVYHLFRGLELTKGRHEIVMEYWPPYRIGKKR
ncbi:MAG: YfhO family protein, partial [Magnetococcales bacterium]|nr:YfhO family protein [Magnetococcales bacterium]